MNEPQMDMSESVSLERGYRRRLAWYPRWFRRENEDEILAVLMACAQENQTRPSLAATFDLLKGATRMWMRPRPGQPRTVFIAIRLMWAGALTSLGGAITVLATLGSVQGAVVHAYAPAWHATQVSLFSSVAETPLIVGLWLWMAWANGRGKNLGRAALAVFFGLDSLVVLDTLAQGSITYAPADAAVGMFECLIGLVTVFLIFNPASSRHYRTSMRNTSSLA
jgi:hypothetical protein